MITYHITQWLSPAIHFIGLMIGIWAFLKSRKKGYILITVYFALAIFSLLVTPRINKAIAKRSITSIPTEKFETMQREIMEIYQRYYEEEETPPKPMTLNLNIPLGPFFLVSGLWVLARKEKNPNQRVEPTVKTSVDSVNEQGTDTAHP